jgi:type IV pilus assembly protein PilW
VQDGSSVAFTSTAQVVNLGQADRVQRVRYYVDPTNHVLYSRNLFDPAAAPVPLASGVVNMKLQYGVDSNDDGFLDDWVSASEAGWDAATLMSAPKTTTPIAQLSRIKAVRIAVVTRSEQFDRDAGAFAHTLFNGAKAPCDGKIDISAPKNWRYRVYENIIPMRNVIWTRAL